MNTKSLKVKTWFVCACTYIQTHIYECNNIQRKIEYWVEIGGEYWRNSKVSGIGCREKRRVDIMLFLLKVHIYVFMYTYIHNIYI